MKLTSRAAAQALKRRRQQRLLPCPLDLSKVLFPEQLAFVQDPARFSTAVCSVRAGKSTACAADLVHTALTMPGTTGLYITLAQSSAEKIIWPELKRLCTSLQVSVKTNDTKLSIKFGNGSKIYCSGAKDASEIEKIRGLSNVALVYIDEAQAFRSHIKELVEEIIVKRLYDTNGRCRLMGTPGPIPSGYFYDVAHNPNWSHHSWTLHVNPWIEKKSGMSVPALIAQDCEKRGVTVDHPSIQRECFGRWVLDRQSLVLQYNAEKNSFDQLPPLPKGKGWIYLLGIDVGFVDADALAVLAWSEQDPCTYLIEELIVPKQGITELAEQIQAMDKKYSLAKMVMDEGGLGKKIGEELRRRWHLPINPADKPGKMTDYALLNDALRSGRFKAKKTSTFAADTMLLEIDREKSTPDKLRVSTRFHSDIIDSVLYGFVVSPAYTYQAPKELPKPGTKEAADIIAEELEAAAEEHFLSLEQAEAWTS